MGEFSSNMYYIPRSVVVLVIFSFQSHPSHNTVLIYHSFSVLTFGSYEMYKKTLLDKFPNVKPIFLYAAAAIMGDLTGSGWLCPSEVVKQRMQAGMYATTGEAVRSILKKKGFGGLYEGYLGGVARDVPFRVAQLCSYEVTKNLYLKIKKQRLQEDTTTSSTHRKTTTFVDKIELSAVDSAVCGAIAGTFSAAITTPLDRIKTLLMTDSAAYGGSVMSCASKILREEGVAGFCTGLAPRVAYIAPSVVIFFVAYEQVQQRLSKGVVETKK
jgi:solute carrier family 25 S-adenosylmethionine transporter 26